MIRMSVLVIAILIGLFLGSLLTLQTIIKQCDATGTFQAHSDIYYGCYLLQKKE